MQIAAAYAHGLDPDQHLILGGLRPRNIRKPDIADVIENRSTHRVRPFPIGEAPSAVRSRTAAGSLAPATALGCVAKLTELPPTITIHMFQLYDKCNEEGNRKGANSE